MKAKDLSLPVLVLVAAAGLWFARSAWRAHTLPKSNMGVGFKTPPDRFNSGRMLRPPDPNRRFTDFTPEQRVQFAKKGHGPGG